MTSSQHQEPNVGRGRKLAVWGAILSCLIVAAAIAASAIATPRTATNTKAAGLQKDLDALVAAGVPGAILFVRDGNHTVRLAAGLGNVAAKTPMRVGDHFKIASLTKTYTASVVLQLVGEGKLSLDDSVEQRLPGLVPNGEGITIRQLLNHTSGLAEFETDPRYLKPYLAGNFGYYWAPRQLVKFGVSHKPLFSPGTRSSYSNTNYVVAQLIVEALTGKKIGAELKSRIFQPLHLRDTSYPTKPGLPSPYAHGYMLLGKPPATDVTLLSPSLAPGSGANRLDRPGRRELLPGAFLRACAEAGSAAGDEDGRLLSHRQGRRHGRGNRPRCLSQSSERVRRLEPQRRDPRVRSDGDVE